MCICFSCICVVNDWKSSTVKYFRDELNVCFTTKTKHTHSLTITCMCVSVEGSTKRLIMIFCCWVWLFLWCRCSFKRRKKKKTTSAMSNNIQRELRLLEIVHSSAVEWKSKKKKNKLNQKLKCKTNFQFELIEWQVCEKRNTKCES